MKNYPSHIFGRRRPEALLSLSTTLLATLFALNLFASGQWLQPAETMADPVENTEKEAEDMNERTSGESEEDSYFLTGGDYYHLYGTDSWSENTFISRWSPPCTEIPTPPPRIS